MSDYLKWDRRFLRLAREVSTWSKDPSTQVGSVLVSQDRSEVTIGYNGFPKWMEDRIEWLTDRDEKLSRMVHAEENVIANTDECRGKTIYVWPFMPCSDCAELIKEYGIRRVVSIHPDEERAQRWAASFEASKKIFRDASIAMDWYFPVELD